MPHGLVTATSSWRTAHPAGLNVEAASEEDVIKRGGLSIWEFSVPSGVSRMLRHMAWADSYSPDGSLISFNANKGRYGPREIWLMDSNGGHARKILDGEDEYGIDSFFLVCRRPESQLYPAQRIYVRANQAHLGRRPPWQGGFRKPNMFVYLEPRRCLMV